VLINIFKLTKEFEEALEGCALLNAGPSGPEKCHLILMTQFFIRMPCLDLLPSCSVFHLGVSQQSVPVFSPQTFEISLFFQ
jgi:hypothetical protein